MAKFEQYVLKDGTKKWKFQGYLGVDYITGKQENAKRSGFNTKREAQLAFNQLKIDYSKGLKEKKSKTLFKEVYELWFPVYKNSVREATWMSTKRRMEKHVLPKFGDLIFERIDVKTAQQFINEWAKEFDMYTKLFSYVKRIGDHAVSMEIISNNPFRMVVTPTTLAKKRKKTEKNKKKELKYYSKEQLNKFLTYCQDKAKNTPDSMPVHQYYAQFDLALFRLLAYSGMRIGEALSLTWQDIDFKEHMLNIDKTLSRTETGYVIDDPKNDASIRVISLDAETLLILKKWQLFHKAFLFKNGISRNNYVFTDITGNWVYRTDTYQRSKRIAEPCGLLNIGNHGFRHTHATMLFEAGVSPKEIQYRLGHSELSVTMDTYTHITKDNEKNAVNKLIRHLNLN